MTVSIEAACGADGGSAGWRDWRRVGGRARATLRFLARRFLQAIPILFGIAIVNFSILQLAPGDAVDVLAGEAGSANPEYMRMLRERFGLDQPTHVQLFRYLLQVAQLDLGFSFRHNMPVADVVLARLPATLLLMVAAIGLSFVAGLILGVWSAGQVGRLADRLISVLVLIFYAVPLFWLGLMLIIVFAIHLGWLPTGGMISMGREMGSLERVFDVARHLMLPMITLAVFYMAIYARLMRASMLEVYGLDYVRTAHAKGLSRRKVAFKHVLRNALLPMVSMLGVQVGSILGGSVMVESVFSWPGLGRLAFDAVLQRDFNMLLGILFLCSVLVIVANAVVDLVYAALDPRIEVR